MKLELRNVGRIKEASILVDGITIICGDNNTGKSTVGKVLYSIYTAFYDLNNNIRRERIDSILRSMGSTFYYHNIVSDLSVEPIEKLVDLDNPTIEAIREAISQVSHETGYELVKEPTKAIEERIRKVLSVKDDDIVTAFLNRILIAEFGGNLANVNSSARKADVQLEVREGTISFHTSGKTQKAAIDQYFSINKRIIYLDDPFILDEANLVYLRSRIRRVAHRELMAGLIRGSMEQRHTNMVEEILHDREIEEIIQKMDSVSRGSLVLKEGNLLYKHTGLKDALSLTSISTGVKTFAILRTLLMSGYLEENGIIVFDEPEVHLHPEWQIKLAEIIVMLKKAYGLNVIITTHSNDFLLALDYYSNLYDVRSNCHFYLTEMEKNNTGFPKVTIKEKTNDMESMYSSVSEPYLRLYSQMRDI